MNGIFVDTGAWYALVDTDDANHGAAAAFLAANTMPLITTNAVFSETVTSSAIALVMKQPLFSGKS